MKVKIRFIVMSIAILTAFLFSSSCIKDAEPPLDEQDGAELADLMGSTKTAIETGDADAFKSLFLADRTRSANKSWNDISEKGSHGSGYPLFLVTKYPELQRATTSVHVKRLVMEEWFDYRREYESNEHIYRTMWAFARDTESRQWKLENFNTRRGAIRYGQVAYGASFTDSIISELNQLDASSFLSLGMKWENSIDPSPLIGKTLQALIDDDIESLKSYTVGGTLFHANGKGVELPSLINDNSNDGEYNRNLALTDLRALTEHIRQGANEMDMDPKELTPFFTAYHITSMPDNCTKLKLSVEFETGPESLKLAGFIVSWTASRLKGKWLVESLVIEEYAKWEYRIEYDME